MKATKTHISLETAKLLKDCGVESEEMFVIMETFSSTENMPNPIIVKRSRLIEKCFCWYKIDTNPLKEESENYEVHYPAFTWQEILWENADIFFNEDTMMEERNKKIGQSALFFDGPEYKYHSIIILELLQQKKYDEADEYFKEHCVLINQ